MSSDRILVLSQDYRDFCLFMREQGRDVPQLDLLGIVCSSSNRSSQDEAIESLRQEAQSGTTHIMGVKIQQSYNSAGGYMLYSAYGDAYRPLNQDKPEVKS